ncbi:hypothetical protein RhiirA4_455917 [Rhizophagus irregularis]|uniref:Uncharacterized protein n=1 Tax=Rhizophagus irregularis TaxID=588596 RepID=A0A2I1G695_9GLOM|nr:hypothetical protein RhiirA4_455917 [Rhizophagus irregularis]
MFLPKIIPIIPLPYILLGYILGAISTFCTGDLDVEANTMSKTIGGGTQLIPGDEFTPRPIIENQLKKILQPPKKSVVLYMICAEFGTEKALSIKKVSKEIGHGIIHVDVPYDVEDFGITFGEAFNFEFEEDITLKNN